MRRGFTGDPFGSALIIFSRPNGNFPDYPHWEVWTDGYYLATRTIFGERSGASAADFTHSTEKMLAGIRRLRIMFILCGRLRSTA